MTSEVLVVGCGVSGLSCAVRLREAGFGVRVAGELPARTSTSSKAAAIWFPYAVGPEARVRRWAQASLVEFERLATDAATGVRLREGREYFRGTLEEPEWRADRSGFRVLGPEELPHTPDAKHPITGGYAYAVPVVEMPIYLDWLCARLLGTVATGRTFATLDEALAEAPVVVNCAGLGARELARDAKVHPIRGQILRVSQPGIDHFVIDEDNPRGLAYVVPRSGDVVLGGTAESGAWEETVDRRESAAIRARCEALVPELSSATPLEDDVGLRPGRFGDSAGTWEVRLEADAAAPPGKLLVHDYGHGGAGVTLSWGCADAVVAIVASRLASR